MEPNEPKSNDCPIVIEFFGLPGSGKTTLCNLACSRLLRLGTDVVSNIELIQWIRQQSVIRKVCFILKDFIFFMKCLCFYHSSPGISCGRIILSAKSMIFLKKYLIQRRPSALLLDQWTVQNIWSTFVGKKKPDKGVIIKIVQYINRYCPRKYLFLKLDVILAAERISKRGSKDSRFDGFDVDNVKTILQQENKLMNDVLDAVGSNGNDLLIVDGARSLEANVDVVMSWIKEQSSR